MMLKRQGLTHSQIASEVGITKARVSQIWHKELAKLTAETAVEAKAARAIELDRIDALLRTAWPLALGKKPDQKWFDRAMNCVELRAKLLGLLNPALMPRSTGPSVDSGEYVITITSGGRVVQQPSDESYTTC